MTNRKHDPDHLIFGDCFMFSTTIPEVIKKMLSDVDAIAIPPNYQPGFPKESFDRIHKLTGKPIIICDFAIRFNEKGEEIRGWKLQENAKVAGQYYAAYIREARKMPYIIGAFWCNPVNSVPGHNKSGAKQGILGKDFKPRRRLNEELIKLNK